jgi:hypothetical protein
MRLQKRNWRQREHALRKSEKRRRQIMRQNSRGSAEKQTAFSVLEGNIVTDIIRRKLVVVGFSFPLGYTPPQVSELLWSQIGLNVDPADITTKDTGTYSASAFISLTEDSLVEFLSRQFETCILGNEQSGAVRFEKKIWREDHDSIRAKKFRVNVDQITITLPTGSTEYNKNGIRKLE